MMHCMAVAPPCPAMLQSASSAAIDEEWRQDLRLHHQQELQIQCHHA